MAKIENKNKAAEEKIIEIPREELFAQGHRACAGCGSVLAIRYALKAAGKNVIVCQATGCMEVVSSPYPETAWKVPWIHVAFENAAAVASGVSRALKAEGKDKEVKVMAIGGDGACYIPKIKILTVDGFKDVEKLKQGEFIWSVNPKTLKMEKTKIKKMHEYDYNNKIIKVNHNFVHFDVSLNHNIPVFNKFNKKIEVIKAYELLNYGRSDKINIVTGNLKWKGINKKYFTLPTVSYHKYSANKKVIGAIPINLWLEFLGYWLSEGHLSIKSTKRERYNIYIAQTNHKTVSKIKSCLSKLPFNYWYSKDRFVISNQQLWTYLKQFGKANDKFIPKEFKDLPTSQIKILLNSLMVGDGQIIKQKNCKVLRYSTISSKLKDDVIEIALKLGYRVHLDTRKRKGRLEYAICICDYKPTTLANLRRKNISYYDYKGKIYCPELERNHILIIEKDGRISLNMNSFDIGLQALSGAVERGENICYVCYDNGAYMNCLSTDTMIMTKEGLKKITEVKAGEYVYAFDQKNYKLVIKKCTGVYDNGIKKVFELNTLHHSIKATSNHPFLVLKRKGRGKKSVFVWKTMAELKQGDEVTVLKKNLEGESFSFKKITISEKGDYKVNKINKISLPDKSNKELMEFLGLYVGDGWVRLKKAETGFALPRGKEGRHRLIKLYKSLFGNSKNISEKDKNYIYIYSINIARFIDSLGFGSGAKNKIIPAWVFTLPAEEKEAFVRGLMFSDGYKIGNSLRYVSASIDLLKSLRLLLQSTGYQVGKIHIQTKKAGQFVVYRQLLEDSTYGYVCFSKKKQANTKQYLSQIKQRDFLADNEFFSTEKIVSLKFVGEEPTLDLRVEGEHNFVADGIVVHNTGIQRSGATDKYAATTTTPAGKKIHGKVEYKKNMPFIIAGHGNCYVATANIAYPVDLIKKIRKGLERDGPAYIQIFSTCQPGWKHPQNMAIALGKLAFETNFYPLFEIEDGVLKISMKPGQRKPVEEFFKFQGRFKHLTKEEIAEHQAHIDETMAELLKMEECKIRINVR